MLVHMSLCVHTELKKLLVTKEELVTDLTNIMYRHTDAVEKLSKIKADADKQLVESMQKIKDLAAEREHQAKELAGLKVVTQVVIDMVEVVGQVTGHWWSVFTKLPKGLPASCPRHQSSTWRTSWAWSSRIGLERT